MSERPSHSVVYPYTATEAVNTEGDAIFLAREAYSLQGARAFLATKACAAKHEAGHAVVGAAQGRNISRIRIWHARGFNGVKTWTGFCEHGYVFSTDPDTPVEEDIAGARDLIAGLVAEMMFDGSDFRYGSSIDERVVFHGVVHNIKVKTDGDHAKIGMRLSREVRAILDANRGVVECIVPELMRRRTLHGATLKEMLHGVVMPELPVT